MAAASEKDLNLPKASSSRGRTILNWAVFCGMVALPLVVLLLPAAFFDNGPALCLSKIIAGQKCYACGMTRACMRLSHGQIAEAGQFNKLSYVVFPIVSLIYTAQLIMIGSKIGLPVPPLWIQAIKRLRLT